MPQQIILRKGTAAAWTLANPTLAAGEPGVETNTGKFKIGNGVAVWSALAYAVGDIPADISDLTDTGNLIPENLGDLANVSSAAPSIGQVLKWDGTQWLPSADATGGEGAGATTLDELTDVTIIGTPAVDSVLKYDGSQWGAGTVTFTDTDTTYDVSAEADAGGAILRLTAAGTGSGTQDILFRSGNNITVTKTIDTISIDSNIGIASGLRYDIPFYAVNGTELSALPSSQLSYDTDTSRLVVKGQISLQTTAGVPTGGLQTATDLTTLSSVGVLAINALTAVNINSFGAVALTGSSAVITSAHLVVQSTVTSIGNPINRASVTLVDAGLGIAGGSNPLTVRSHSNVAAYTPAITLQKIKGASFGTPDAIVTGDVISAVRFSTFDGVTTTTNITNVSRLSGIATYTVDANHGLPVGTAGPIGHVVSVACSDTSFNAVHATVISVPNTTTFTVATGGNNVSSVFATGTVDSRNFDVRAAVIRAEATGTVAAGIVPGTLRLLVANSAGALVTGLLINSTQAVAVNGTFAINGTANGLRIGSTNGTGGALVSAVGTSVVLPAGSTIAGVAIGSIKVLGTRADNTALNAVVGMVAGDAYVLLNATPNRLWSYTGSAWVDLGPFQGAAGTNGTNGTNGQGVVVGGTTGQVLAKIDGTAYNTEWISLSAVATSGNYNDIAGAPADLSQFTDTTGIVPVALTDLGIIDGANGQVLTTDGAGSFTFSTTAAGSGDVVGPAAAADNALARYDLTTGKLLKNSLVTVSDTGAITAPSVGSVIPFYFADQAAFPVATTYHGAVAHSHADGKMYFAHSGTWNALANITDIVNTTYGISAETATGGVNLRLTGSDAATDNVKLTAGANITLSRTSADEITIAASGSGTASNSFATISVAGQSDVAADSATDTLTLVAGTNVTITTNAGTDTVTINAAGGGATALSSLTDVVITGTPTDGQVLKYNTATSKWINGTDATGGGGALPTRATVSGVTSSLADGGVGPINITGYRSYMLMKVQTSAAAWVRIYTSESARIADASRLEGTDPLPGAGVVAEIITTGAQTVLISPGALGFNDEGPVTTNIPCRVTNKSGGTAAITVTLTALQLEA